MDIDELPEALLVEVLCRVGCSRFVFQCKCVSKRWRNLVSTPYFIRRYLRHQRDLQTPILSTIVNFDHWRTEKMFLTSEHPAFTTRSRNFTLGFLPCYRELEGLKKLASSLHEVWDEPSEAGFIVPPAVVDTYKDLVLCSATWEYQRDYFICNPFTKQWAALPPVPRVYDRVYVALVVSDPYYNFNYKYEEQQHVEYVWKVVRLVPTGSWDDDLNFNVDIFSSETGEWTELVVLNSLPFWNCCEGLTSAVAYNGMLYWYLENDGDCFVFELDLELDQASNIAKCRFIRLLEDLRFEHGAFDYLFVSGGHLQLCFLMRVNGFFDIRVWELKQVVEHRGNFKWLVEEVAVTCEGEFSMKMISEYSGLCFLKHNEGILYLKGQEDIFTFNVHREKLKVITKVEYKGVILFTYYPLVLPWWPTPVPGQFLDL